MKCREQGERDFQGEVAETNGRRMAKGGSDSRSPKIRRRRGSLDARPRVLRHRPDHGSDRPVREQPQHQIRSASSAAGRDPERQLDSRSGLRQHPVHLRAAHRAAALRHPAAVRFGDLTLEVAFLPAFHAVPVERLGHRSILPSAQHATITIDQRIADLPVHPANHPDEQPLTGPGRPAPRRSPRPAARSETASGAGVMPGHERPARARLGRGGGLGRRSCPVDPGAVPRGEHVGRQAVQDHAQ